MVLRSLVALVATLAVSGCIHRVPHSKLAPSTPVAVAYYVDGRAPDAKWVVPNEVRVAVGQAIASRNGVVRVVSGLSGLRTTAQRLAELARDAPGSKLLLLIELRVEYFDQMEGRFKWIVHTKLSLAEPHDLPGATTHALDVPVFLRFDFEHEPQALVQAASLVGDSVGRLLDEVAAGENVRVPVPAVAGSGLHTPRTAPHAIYMILVDRYADGDLSNDQGVDRSDPEGFHGGDLQGVIDHLDDIQALGFDTVWLSPVWKCRHAKFHGHGAYHGYWVSDFSEIDPSFGNRRLLRRLSDALHRRHMKLLLDVVLNHVAFDSPLLKLHPEWFHHNGDIKDWNDPVQLVNNDVMGLPDLAQERDDVYRYLLSTSEMWIDAIHPDGFRLDAVKHVGAAFWQRFNREIHAYAGPGFFLLGEDLDGDPVTLGHAAAVDGFDAVFDFPLYFAVKDVFCDGKPMGELAAVLSQDGEYVAATRHVTLVDNHDLARIATACHGDEKRIGAAFDFISAVRGTPSVTYGTAVGLTGAQTPQNRGDMVFGPPTALSRRMSSDLAKVRPEGPARIEVLSADRLVIRNADSIVDVTRDGVAVGSAQHAADQSAPRAVVFEVTGAPTGSVVAVGAGTSLGDWHPEHGVALSGGALTLPTEAVYEYKFAARQPGGAWLWESRANRFLLVSPGSGALTVKAQWNGS